jgi:putative ABC transport system ATP-binding protein
MIQLDKVCRYFKAGSNIIKALNDITLNVETGEFIVVQGPSGSGKTTLLMTMGGMLGPTSGSVIVNQNDVYKLNMKNRAKFRAENIGFVFQMFHLLPYLSSIENVLLTASVKSNTVGESEALELLNRMRLSHRVNHKPSQLSVGERQRTAVARALINKPKIILADEPTGNLDPENAAEVVEYLVNFNRSGGTVIIASHGNIADPYSNRVIRLKEGQILE